MNALRESTELFSFAKLDEPSGGPYHPHMTLTNLSASQLRRAASLKERIESLESELSRLLAVNGSASLAAVPGTTGRRTLSAAARRKIAAAQRRRWAKRKAAGGASNASAPKKKRHMSAAARAKIAEAARRRWAAVRAKNA